MAVERIFAFVVLGPKALVPEVGEMKAVLIQDRWDDWGKYRTQFQLYVFDQQGKRHRLGSVKIGQKGLKAGISSEEKPGKTRAPKVPRSFSALGDDLFSLGQDEDYYETLGKLDDAVRIAVTTGLRDVVALPALWRSVADENVTKESLLREVRRKTLEQFRRLLDGGAKLSPYRFSYTYPKRTTSGADPISLTFEVHPESTPPNNIHVLVGRNGVGKTHTLSLMTKALIGDRSAARQSGRFEADTADSDEEEDNNIPFANLVYVSFSAFDEFEPPPETEETGKRIQFSYVGLRRPLKDAKTSTAPKSPQMLTSEFTESARACITGLRLKRWNRLLGILETDPMFKAAEVANTLAEADDLLVTLEDQGKKLFSKLSSGHKIVLLSIARLVETVDEKTLVLIDEPEAHLHPPLLAAFVRALSDLLINRNGVAIIATHSPVVLQEVPKDCVWKLTRNGLRVDALRPEIETFGENVGVLTREVFGLEVVKAGFHKMLSDAADTHGSYEDALEHFESKLGAEGRAILRSMFNRKARATEDL
jgi:ABC-type branched-subunit amino acid transport system ATPase component